jgi:hypothetical protein
LFALHGSGNQAVTLHLPQSPGEHLMKGQKGMDVKVLAGKAIAGIEGGKLGKLKK